MRTNGGNVPSKHALDACGVTGVTGVGREPNVAWFYRTRDRKRQTANSRDECIHLVIIASRNRPELPDLKTETEKRLKGKTMQSKFIHNLLAATIAITATFSAAPAISGSETVRDHRAKVTVRDHRTKRKSETVIVGRGEISCEYGTNTLVKMGYRLIRAYDCKGAVFHYAAVSDTVIVRAAMSSHTGQIRVETVGILTR